MEDRHTRILLGLIQEYIRLAVPIGSTHIQKVLELAISPATVRHILHELEEAGYIFQPHTSAGRIPTDKGYRFYIAHIQQQKSAAEQQQLLVDYLKLYREYHRRSEAAARLIAQLAQSMAVSGSLPSGEIGQAGLTELLDQPEGSRLESVREVSEFLDDIHSHMMQLAALHRYQTGVFVGDENPVFPAAHTSMLVRTARLPQGEEVVLMILGPKRMPYERNINLLEGVANLLEERHE